MERVESSIFDRQKPFEYFHFDLGLVPKRGEAALQRLDHAELSL